MSDEVAVVRASACPVDMQATAVRIALKNVSNRADGPYLLKVSGDWSQSPRQENAAGIVELMPPRVLALESAPTGKVDEMFFFLDEEMPREETTRQIPEDQLPGLRRLGATVEHGEDGMIRIQVFGEDKELRRWVSIGSAEVGPGTQSSTRKVLGAVLLPFAVVVDVIALPVYYVVFATTAPD